MTSDELEKILSSLDLHPEEVCAVYAYGSIVYGTEDKDSDTDLIIVSDRVWTKKHHRYSDLCDATVYSIIGFKQALEAHEHSVLESLSSVPYTIDPYA